MLSLLVPIHTMRHVSVPSEWSVFVLSVVFIHLPQQHMIGDRRLFPSDVQPTATECIFCYLLIIGTSVINRIIVNSKCAIKKH